MSDDDIYCRRCNEYHDEQHCPSEAKDAENTRLLSTLESCRAELAEWKDLAEQYREQLNEMILAAGNYDKQAREARAEVERVKNETENHYMAALDDARTRMEAAERCSGEWMKDRNLAIHQRDKAEAQLSHFTGEKRPIFIHAGDHCPAEAANSENARLATLNGQEVVRLTERVKELEHSAAWETPACARYRTENAALLAKIEKMREALMFYAEIKGRWRGAMNLDRLAKTAQLALIAIGGWPKHDSGNINCDKNMSDLGTWPCTCAAVLSTPSPSQPVKEQK